MTTQPDAPLKLKNDGDHCFTSGDFTGAIRHYLRALELDPEYIAAWNNLGYAFSKSGRSGDAARCREKIAQLRAHQREPGETSPVYVRGARDIPRPAGEVRDHGGLSMELKISSSGRPDQESSRSGTPELPAAGTAVLDTDAPRDQGFWGRLKRPSLSSPEKENHDASVLPAASTVPQATTPDKSGFWGRLRRSPRHTEKEVPDVGNPELLAGAPEGGADSSELSRGSSGLLSGLKYSLRSKTPHGPAMAGQDQEPQTAMDALRMEGGEVYRFKGGRSVCTIQNCGQLVDGFDRVLEQHPELSAGFRGIALYSLGRYREALEDFDRELGLDPGAAGIWILRAWVLTRLGREQEALSSCEQALRLDRGNFDAWRQSGFVLQSLGRDQEALHALDQAISLNPHSAEIWVARGRILHALSRDHEALQSYDRSLAIDPRSSDLWLSRARSLSRLGREEEALASLEQGIAANPDNPLLFICQGRLFHATRRFGEALTAYDRALTLRPDDARTWEDMGGVLHDLGKFRDEAAAYDRALASRPGAGPLYEKRGNARALSGKHSEAADDFRRALEFRPGDPPLIRSLEAALAAAGEQGEGRDVAGPVPDTPPDGGDNLKARGEDLLALIRYREAVETFREAASRHPGDAGAIQGLREAEAALAELDAGARAEKAVVRKE